MTPGHTGRIAAKPVMLEKVLFLDGISRSSKKLNCRLLAQFEAIESFNYLSLIENTCYLHYLGHFDAESAARFMRLNIDEASYDRLIGRRLNTRPGDESSIFRTPDLTDYVRRTTLPDGKPAVEAFRASGRLPLYHTHSMLPFAEIVFTALPAARLIHIGRNPIDIAHDWLTRGWGDRWSDDPLVFTITMESGESSVPWFAASWSESYLQMTPSERCIRSILFLQELERAALSKLTPQQKKQILQYRLEHLLRDPKDVIKNISTFTGHPTRSNIEAFLVSENLPNPQILDRREFNLKALAKNADPGLINEVIEASQAYDAQL